MCASPAARAFDAEVRADTQAQAYQVRGPAGTPVLSLRRFTETLTLGAVERVDHHVTWTLRARLRVDSDFGTACDPTTDRCLDELNRSRAAEFAPLAARRTLDLPFAYLEGSGLLRGTTTVRLGRQLVTDALGMFLFDGVRVRARLADVALVEVYGGLETRAGFPLSNGRYERDGIVRADRTGWDPTLAPQVRAPSLAGAVAASLETAGDGVLFARATYRRVWGADGIAEEKLGLSADLTPSDAWRVWAEAVHAIPQRSLASLALGVTHSHANGRVLAFELSRWRPTFDLTAIWSSFWTDPVDDARARAELPLGGDWKLLLALTGRRYALSESASSPDGDALPDVWTVGGDAGLARRSLRTEASLRAHGEGGGLGARVGADLVARTWLSSLPVRLDGSLSAWWVDDALRPDRSLTSFAVVVGAMVRMGRVADVALNLEDDINRIVGHRLRAVAVVTLRSPF